MDTLIGQRRENGFSLRQLCGAAHVPYRTFMRWKSRRAAGRPAVEEPGPGPAGPLDLDGVWERVRSLNHGRKRTRGTGELYRELRGMISRRHLRALVKRARRDARRERDAAVRRLEWTPCAGRVWATDTMETALADGTRVWFQTIRDLGARYTIAPVVLHHPDGEDIACRLDEAFARFGAPLFLRLDNATSENCPKVQEVLARHRVIPFNSPPHYPQYNGGVERAQGEIREEFDDWTAGIATVPPEHMHVYAAATAHGLNHKPRPVLDGRHACQVFTRDGRQATVTPGDRQEVLNELIAAAAVLLDTEDGRTLHDVRKAWRRAVEWWLQTHDLIRDIKDPGVNQFPAQTGDNICVA